MFFRGGITVDSMPTPITQGVYTVAGYRKLRSMLVFLALTETEKKVLEGVPTVITAVLILLIATQ